MKNEYWKSAKPVTYKGVQMRSTLEGRWAVFFDALGIPWEYEPKRFYLSGDRSYLPDFRLWGWVYAEAKPAFSGAEAFDKDLIIPIFQKWHAMTKEHRVDLFQLWGAPRLRWYPYWLCGEPLEKVDFSQLAVMGPGYSAPIDHEMPSFYDRELFMSALKASATFDLGTQQQ